MSYIIVGLGNPGEEYLGTRHNTGRIVLEYFRKKNDFPDWEKNGKLNALISEGKIGKEKLTLLEPETFMNKSGVPMKLLVTSTKRAEQLVVIHDDLDIPIGSAKMSFNKSSGGHRGVESIMRTIKTEAFVRVRVGISPKTPSGKLRKPKGDKAVGDFILGQFKKTETDALKKVSKNVADALALLVTETREKATGELNSK